MTNAFLVALGDAAPTHGASGALRVLDLTGQLAKLTLWLAQEDGTDAADGNLGHRLTQSELAAMIGAFPPAVSGIMQELAARGIIYISGQTISLRDIHALRRRALG